VINRGPYNRQPDRDIDAGLDAEDFHGSMTWIVVHGDNNVEVAPAGSEKKCVGW
jgi:hypothetical protein